MLRTEDNRFFQAHSRRFVARILAFSAVILAGTSAFAKTGDKSQAAVKATASPIIAWERLEEPMAKLRTLAEIYARDSRVVGSQDLDNLEVLANEAVLARLIKSVYVAAAEKKWIQTQGYRIFPVENLLSNSAKETPVAFNPNGFRVAVFAMRLGRTQRGILLTTSFQSTNPAELRELYKSNAIVPLVDRAEKDFSAFGTEIVQRLQSGDSRKSRHMQVVGTAQAWSVGCEITIANRFCVNASLFDSNDTDPATFVTALTGARELSPNVAMIKAENLAWPIENTYISRGFKSGNAGRHFGLDLTAPEGTPVYAIGRGVVLHAKQFSGWGKAVVIEHELPDGSKFISLYAHLSKFRKNLVKGDVIERGALIAATGKSGSSAAGNAIPPHLHLEIRNAPEGKEPLQQPRGIADRPIDPLLVLDVFNVFVGSESLSAEAGEIMQHTTR